MFLVLQHLGLLAREVSEQIAEETEQGTNSSAFRKQFGAMPERAAILKNVRQIIPRYGFDVGLTPAGEESFGNVHQVLRAICVPENLIIWSCQYMILLNNMVYSSKWSHKRECESIRKRPASSSSVLVSGSVKKRGVGSQRETVR